MAPPAPCPRIPQHLLHLSFVLRAPQSPRAGSCHQYPPQGWIRHSQSSVWVLGDTLCPLQPLVVPLAHKHPLQLLQGAALKTCGCSNQHKKKKIFSPGRVESSPCPLHTAWTHFSLPHFCKGMRDQDPSHTHRADRKGVPPSKPLQYGQAMLTSWESSLKPLN